MPGQCFVLGLLAMWEMILTPKRTYERVEKYEEITSVVNKWEKISNNEYIMALVSHFHND